MPSLWDCSDCPAVREAWCCREVRKGKKNHSSHRQIEMCQEWDHLFQLQVPICKPSREMKLKTGVWYIRSGRRYTQVTAHTSQNLFPSSLPLTLANAHPGSSQPLQKEGEKGEWCHVGIHSPPLAWKVKQLSIRLEASEYTPLWEIYELRSVFDL